jgi:hypothetical protein
MFSVTEPGSPRLLGEHRHVVCSDHRGRRCTMTARWVGVLTAGASVLLGAAARADTGGAVGGRELSGRVIKSEASTLYLEHMGAVVPVEIGSETRFSGVRSAHELAAGQEVRASFTVKRDTKNVAHRISLAPPTRAAEPPAPVFTDQG